MEKAIIVEGKTSTEAIEKGLKQLKCRREDVEIKVLENEEKRSFFSILEPRIVKVEMTLKKEKKEVKREKEENATAEDIEKCEENIKKFLNNFVNQIKDLQYVMSKENNSINIEIKGNNASKLIGYRGETIKALQTIMSAIGNKNVKNRVKVLVDVGGYKEKREETLKELAKKLEKTVKRNGKKIVLEPMSSYERKILHTELQNSDYVTTYSIGEEPRRRIVIDKKQ